MRNTLESKIDAANTRNEITAAREALKDIAEKLMGDSFRESDCNQPILGNIRRALWDLAEAAQEADLRANGTARKQNA